MDTVFTHRVSKSAGNFLTNWGLVTIQDRLCTMRIWLLIDYVSWDSDECSGHRESPYLHRTPQTQKCCSHYLMNTRFIAPNSWLLAWERMKFSCFSGNRNAIFLSSSYPSSQTKKRCRRVLATSVIEPTVPLFKRWKTVPVFWVARPCVGQHQQVSQSCTSYASNASVASCVWIIIIMIGYGETLAVRATGSFNRELLP